MYGGYVSCGNASGGYVSGGYVSGGYKYTVVIYPVGYVSGGYVSSGYMVEMYPVVMWLCNRWLCNRWLCTRWFCGGYVAVAFKIYDIDRDGFISNGELFQVSATLGQNVDNAKYYIYFKTNPLEKTCSCETPRVMPH